MGEAQVFVGVQRSNSAWRVSEGFPEMTTFELGFEGYIGVCHVQNWVLSSTEVEPTLRLSETQNNEYGGKLVRLGIFR